MLYQPILLVILFDSNSATTANVTCSSKCPLKQLCERFSSDMPWRGIAGSLVIPLQFSLSNARLFFRMTTSFISTFWLTPGIAQLLDFYESTKWEVVL